MYAEEEVKEDTEILTGLYDFSELDRMSEDVVKGYTFSEIVSQLAAGNIDESVGMIKDSVCSVFFDELLGHKEDILQVFILSILSAMFMNMSIIIDKTEIAQMGFLMTYLALITILIHSFQTMSEMVYQVTEQVVLFLKVAIPSMALSVGMCSGQVTALGFAELALMVIYIGEILLKKIVLPAIMAYMILLIVNYILQEDYLSKFANVLKNIVQWFLKSFVAIVIGMNLVKGMLLPGVDAVGKNAAVKVANMIPGVDEITGAGGVLVSSLAVVKNAVGGTVIVILLGIVAVPLVKMFIYILSYKAVGALLQPLTDKRIIKSIDVVADAGELLQKVLVTQIVLVVLSVALICIVTN